MELRNNIGEIVFDYIRILDKSDLQLAKQYLKAWHDPKQTKVWNGRKYVERIVFTLERFKIKKEYIEITIKLLQEI